MSWTIDPMIDIGVNLLHESFLQNLQEFRSQSLNAGVENFIAISSHLEESQQLCTLSKTEFDHQLLHTIGCHPHHADTWNNQSYDQFSQLIMDHKAIAVGETGLDFNRNFSTQDNQRKAFIEQIELAKHHHLPLYLHEREAFSSLKEILISHSENKVRGVIHCFTGDKDCLKSYLDLGLYIGVTGWVCDERRGMDLQEAVKYIPRNRLLVETDAPYLLPRNIRPRPKKNHPKYLPYVVDVIAQLRGETSEYIRQITLENTKILFEL